MNKELIDIFKNHRDAFEAQHEQITPGVFCDIAGTLLAYNPETKGTEINQGVLTYIRAQKAAGKSVTLISNVENNGLMLGTGLQDEFGDVIGKAVLRNMTLEILIDDDPTLKAEKLIDPTTINGRNELQNTAEINTTQDSEPA